MLRQALVLAGGRGTRLGALTDTLPKPMLDVGGVPFLEYLIHNLRRFGVDDIVLSVGYRAQAIESHFGDGRACGVAVRYSRESHPLGTGGGLRQALPLLDETFLALNGDTLFDCNYLDLALQLDSGAKAALALRRVDDASRYGSVVCDGPRVTVFGEKSRTGPGDVSAGVYALTRQAAATLPPGASSIEQDLFPGLAARGELVAKAYPGFFLDIGLPETLALAGRALPEWRQKPCVFLDRDGVLNADFGHERRPEDFRWTDGAIEAVKWCNDRGWLVVAIADQSGTRGSSGAARVDRLTAWMQEALRSQGAHLDAAYLWPHHPIADAAPPCRICDRGRHAESLVRQAIAEWRIDPARSLMVSAKFSDLAAGAACGVSGKRFPGGNLLTFLQRHITPSFS